MTILLDIDSNYIYVKASPGDTASRDLINSFPAREAVYDNYDFFLHYKLPQSYLVNLLEKTTDIEPITGKADYWLKQYQFRTTPLADLDRFEIVEFDGYWYPRGYQADYISIDPHKKRILCSLDMGMGKTVSAIWRAVSMYSLVGNGLTVIAPKNVVTNWETHLSENDCEVIVYAGTPKKRKKLREEIGERSIVVTNYELVKELPFAKSIVIDEVHNISNPSTRVYKQIKAYADQAEYVQGLSGTPIRLGIRNLWAVLNLIDPMIAGDEDEFVKQFERTGPPIQLKTTTSRGYTFYREVAGRTGVKNVEKLAKKLESIMYRVKRDEHVSFKDTVDIVTVGMTPAQEKMYKEIERDLAGGDSNLLLVRILRLLQAAEGTFNLNPELIESGKLDYIKDELDSNSEKIIIWSRFKKINFLLEGLYKDRAVVYNGDISDGLRKLGVWAFQGCTPAEEKEYVRLTRIHKDWRFAPGEASIFVGTVNLRSGLGINLHSASRCIFTSFDPNPNANIQAKDRIARLNQLSDEVYTRFLVSKGTIEAKMLRLALEYYEASLKVLDRGEAQDLRLTKEIMKLLRENNG